MPAGIFKGTMADMKWTDIQYDVDHNALALLPLGVIEEHGPQLCLGTDIYTAHLYCLAVKKKLEENGHLVTIAPPFYWGVCQSTGGFIGSFKIRKETAKLLLIDILSSLAGFGFKNIYGVNAHGDVEHSIAIIEAFKEAGESLGINARYLFDEWRLQPFGLNGSESFLCPVKQQTVIVSTAKVPDVHGGDIETATIHEFYPELVDIEKAKSLPPVALSDDKGYEWLFGGHTNELSPEGYMGSPADFESVDVLNNINDYAERFSKAILERLIV
jgi:creatinine amidohydrolase